MASRVMKGIEMEKKMREHRITSFGCAFTDTIGL